MKKNTVRLDDFSWVELKELIDNGFKTVVFGIGATEQHGPALPLKSDALQADEAANLIANELPKTLQAPTIHVGYSKYHINFPGTISLRESTLQAVIEDYIDSLVHHGFDKMVIYISHGGDVSATEKALVLKQESTSQCENVLLLYSRCNARFIPIHSKIQLSPGSTWISC